MRVLGVDPGTVRMGYAVLESGPKPEAGDYGVVALSNSMPLEQRLYQLHTHMLNLIHIFHPDVIAVEEPFVGRGERQFIGPAMIGVAVMIRVGDHNFRLVFPDSRDNF